MRTINMSVKMAFKKFMKVNASPVHRMPAEQRRLTISCIIYEEQQFKPEKGIVQTKHIVTRAVQQPDN